MIQGFGEVVFMAPECEIRFIPPQIRLLQGRALIRLDPSEYGEHLSSGGLVIPASTKPREQRCHRGRVLALGEPMCTRRRSIPIEWECKVGDEVLFVYALWLEKMRHFDDIAVVAQSEIIGVYESSFRTAATRPALCDHQFLGVPWCAKCGRSLDDEI